MNQRVYIVKPYSDYLPPERDETILKRFTLYGNKYCISEVALEWGQPRVSRPVGEQDNFGYFLYNTYEEAELYVKKLKRAAM